MAKITAATALAAIQSSPPAVASNDVREALDKLWTVAAKHVPRDSPLYRDVVAALRAVASQAPASDTREAVIEECAKGPVHD